MRIPIVYTGIFMASMYLAVVGHGYIVALAFIVGGIAFFALQSHFYSRYAEITAEEDSEDDDDQMRLPPA
jgi:hypothetical protein